MPIPPLPLGSRRRLTGGYYSVKTETGWRAEHLVVAEKALGRKLAANERVHFKDGIIENPTMDDLEIRYTNPPTKYNLTRSRSRLLKRLRELDEQREELIQLIVPVNRKLGRADEDFRDEPKFGSD